MIQCSVKSLLNRIKDESDSRRNTSSSTIYMAPGILRDVSPSSFIPRIVSIGPLHRDDTNLQAFEGQKVSCLNKVLSRTGVSKEETLESCMREVYASMQEIKRRYVWTKVYEEAQIAEMMVMDACFILEFIHWSSEHEKSYPDLENRLFIQSIVFDLVLLENQIPLFIIDQIYQCTIFDQNPVSLIEYMSPILDYFNLFYGQKLEIPNVSTKTTPHILGLLHECYKPPSSIQPHYFPSLMYYSAQHLDKAGVNFKPIKDPTWPLKIEVKLIELPCCYGSWNMTTLKIPVLYVHDFTEVILRNLIAYEQSNQTFNYIISYANVMNMLVKTPKDVAKLVDSEVLINGMGSNKKVANMLNNICRNVTCLDFYYTEECKMLTSYCDAYWPKHIFKLKRTYFNSPWNIIALAAGSILFAFSAFHSIRSIISGSRY